MSESNEALEILAREPVVFEIKGKTYAVRRMSRLSLYRFQRLCEELGVKAFPYPDPAIMAKSTEDMTESERDYIVTQAVDMGVRKLAAITVALRESDPDITFDIVADWFTADSAEDSEKIERLFRVTQTGSPDPPPEPEESAGNELASVSGAD